MCWEQTVREWASVGGVAVGLLAVLVAYSQLSRIRKTSKADFIQKFSNSFFTPETRNLMVLLFNSAIEFSVLSIKDEEGKNDRLPYFKIKDFVLDQLKNNGLISLDSWRKGYNAFEIDDLLLGPLDDVGRFERKGLIDLDTAYNTFGYYICELVGKNEAVKKLLDDEDSKGNYDDLNYIYKKFISKKMTSKKLPQNTSNTR